MTSGSSFEYWSSISGLYVEVRFYSAHSIQLLSPWFPARVSCSGVCILPGQRVISEVSVTMKTFQMHHQKKSCSYLHSSHLQDLTTCTKNNSKLLSPSRCLAVSTTAAHQISKASKEFLWEPCCCLQRLVLHTHLIRAQGHTSDMQGTCINAPRTDMHWWLRGK